MSSHICSGELKVQLWAAFSISSPQKWHFLLLNPVCQGLWKEEEQGLSPLKCFPKFLFLPYYENNFFFFPSFLQPKHWCKYSTAWISFLPSQELLGNLRPPLQIGGKSRAGLLKTQNFPLCSKKTNGQRMQRMCPDAALPCLMCSSCLELGIPILSLGNSPGAAAAALCFSPEEQNKKIFVLNKGHGWGITDWCFAVFGKMLSCSSLHRKFWKLVLRGGLTFQVYMQEKFSPLKRIFFCISRVSAVLGHAPQKWGGGEEVSTLYRVSHWK